jgi:hypothetical protein
MAGISNDEDAQSLGYNSIQEFLSGAKEAVNNAKTAWEDADLSDTNISEDAQNKLSLGTSKALKTELKTIDDNRLLQMVDEAGNKIETNASQIMENVINSVLSSADASDYEDIVKAFTDVDWSDWDAAD